MEKIKQFLENERGKDILVVIIVILVGLASFELGRLSKENASNGIKIQYSGQEANAINAYQDSSGGVVSSADSSSSTNSSIKNFFASKRGKKYYPVDCSAGKTIKEENKVYFATREDAQKAGYDLSSSCQ